MYDVTDLAPVRQPIDGGAKIMIWSQENAVGFPLHQDAENTSRCLKIVKEQMTKCALEVALAAFHCQSYSRCTTHILLGDTRVRHSDTYSVKFKKSCAF